MILYISASVMLDILHANYILKSELFQQYSTFYRASAFISKEQYKIALQQQPSYHRNAIPYFPTMSQPHPQFPWYKSGIKFLTSSPATLDFPPFLPNRNLLPLQINILNHNFTSLQMPLITGFPTFSCFSFLPLSTHIYINLRK